MVSLRAFSRAAMASASGKRSFIGSIYALQSHTSEGPLCRLPALLLARSKVQWDNLENTHWDSMGSTAKVGHDKMLKTGKCLAPPPGTITRIRL